MTSNKTSNPGRPFGIHTKRQKSSDITRYCVPYKESCLLSQLPFAGDYRIPSLKTNFKKKFSKNYKAILGQICLIINYIFSVYTKSSKDGLNYSFFLPCTNSTLSMWFNLELHTVWASQLVNKRLWNMMELGIIVAADNGYWSSPFSGNPSARRYFINERFAKSVLQLARQERITLGCRWLLKPVSKEECDIAVKKAEDRAKHSKTFAKYLNTLKSECISGKHTMIYPKGPGLNMSSKAFWHLVNGLFRQSSPWYNDLEKDISSLNSFEENKGAWAYSANMNVKTTTTGLISGMSFRTNTRLCGMQAHNGTHRMEKGSERDLELTQDLGKDYIKYDFHASILNLTKAIYAGSWSAPVGDVYNDIHIGAYGNKPRHGNDRKKFKFAVLSSYMPTSLKQATHYAYRRELAAVTGTLTELMGRDRLLAPYSNRGRKKLIAYAKQLHDCDGFNIDYGYETARNLEKMIEHGKQESMGSIRKDLYNLHESIVLNVGAPLGSVIFEFESCLITKLCLELRKRLNCTVRNVFDAVYVPKTKICTSIIDLKILIEEQLMPKIFDDFYKKWKDSIEKRISIAYDNLNRWSLV